ncbi:flavin-containing monooxygenase [Nakamurella deserti]|uniref:flavin-containing monooxygenase n=1 Tax=Nakamurella deserti TaxID=2164074 RepID=UPI000DBE3B51|nr:NAD(P)/FAD-dependent oxidoreductase [Nakamurella deserti]
MSDHVDVLIVGAGLSGIGTACRLVRECPDATFAVLECRDATGGTWDVFRYPGVRSDSDMLTLSYDFRLWPHDGTLADGAAILHYLRETAAAYGIDRRVRFRHRAVAASWSSADARWTVTVRDENRGSETIVTCSMLSVCTGYYRLDRGWTPDFPGLSDFAGPVVHPQHWPDGLPVEGRRVAVIGSGATAMSMVPALAAAGARVTMVQRTPSWVAALPSRDRGADAARRLPRRLARQALRWRNIVVSVATYQLSRRRPAVLERILRRGALHHLPPAVVDAHFTPAYRPWDQRLCLVPDGDLLDLVADGTVELVTDTVERFGPGGPELGSGRHVDADIVVTATGLEILLAGGMHLTVDGRDVDPASTVGWKAMMLSGVPNLVITVGYTNASWTLKSDLVAGHLCRLWKHRQRHGWTTVVPDTPALRPDELRPMFDLRSGYVLRSRHLLPRQGPRGPWRSRQNYLRDRPSVRRGRLTDGLTFSRAAP